MLDKLPSADTFMQFLRARWYNRSVGRFINEDTYEGQLNNPLTLNLYTYVGNNPLIRWDPSGHFWYEDLAKEVLCAMGCVDKSGVVKKSAV